VEGCQEKSATWSGREFECMQMRFKDKYLVSAVYITGKAFVLAKLPF
jgi:hypothetical protein